MSSLDRVLKRYPELKRFESNSATFPRRSGRPAISNGPASPAVGEAVEFSTLLAIGAGVPRSFPFHNLSVQFRAPEFGDAQPAGGLAGAMTTGVIVGDSWWVNGRERSLSALTSVEADPSDKKLPSPPVPVAAVLAACGKVMSAVQIPLAGAGIGDRSASSRAGFGCRARRQRRRRRLPGASCGSSRSGGASSRSAPGHRGVDDDSPRGDDAGPRSRSWCVRSNPWVTTAAADRGHLRYAAGLPAISRWKSISTSAPGAAASRPAYRFEGLGFAARLPLPVARRAIGSGQYQMGGAERWQQIVDNLAALVAELDRSFVPDVEAASGPSPAWYTPET